MDQLATTLQGRYAARKRIPDISAEGFVAIWALSDVAIVAVTGVLSSWLRFGAVDLSGPRGLAITLAMVIAWVAFKHVGLHDLEVARKPLSQLRRATTAIIITVLVVATIGYLTRTGAEISRLWIAIWLLWAFLAFVATRTLVSAAHARLEAAGTFALRYVVFASAELLPRLESLLTRWRAFMPTSHHVSAIFLDRLDGAARGSFRWRHLVVGSFDDFSDWNNRETIDQAVVLMPPDDRDALESLLDRLGIVATDVDLIAGDVDTVWARNKVAKVAGLPAVRIMTRPLDAWQRMAKRIEDVVVAGVSLLILGPFMLLIALAVKLDSPGPALFRQLRHGFNNRTFHVLKFRTMRNNRAVLSTVEQAKHNDPRVTRVGAILRKTSLDELPQLINVLRGDMSVVGPRPHAIQHNDHFAQRIRSYLARHRVKPGITGWAQVNGFRGETDTLDKMRKRVEYDLFYVDHWSLTFDIKIILLTARCLVHANAY